MHVCMYSLTCTPPPHTHTHTILYVHQGDKGALGETMLESTRSSFERNSVDVFTISGTDVGAVKELAVRLAERGVGAAWHLKQVEVLNKKTGAKVSWDASLSVSVLLHGHRSFHVGCVWWGRGKSWGESCGSVGHIKQVKFPIGILG